MPAAALAFLSGIPADNPQGLPTADTWPLLQTIGVFVGLPVAAMAVIVALVMLQSGTRRARGTSATAVFTGPQAGAVDAAARSGSGPRTETGEASGMHREVAQPPADDAGPGPSGQGRQDGGSGPDAAGSADASTDEGAADGSDTAARAGATRRGSGGSGARW